MYFSSYTLVVPLLASENVTSSVALYHQEYYRCFSLCWSRIETQCLAFFHLHYN